MAVLLAQLTLVVLCFTGLCLFLLQLPAPRLPLGIVVSLLIVAQVVALRAMHEEEQVYVYPPPEQGALGDGAVIVGAFVVPALTTVVLTLLTMYLLQARRAVILRLERARVERARAVPRA